MLRHGPLSFMNALEQTKGTLPCVHQQFYFTQGNLHLIKVQSAIIRPHTRFCQNSLI